MYDVVVRYLARAFVKVQAPSPSVESFSGLAVAVDRRSFLPLPFDEVGPAGIHPRVGLRSADGTRLVFMRSESADFEYHQPRDPATGRLSLEEFAAEAAHVLAGSLDFLGVHAHRIAVVQEGLLPALPTEQMSAVAIRLLNAPKALHGAVPFEWDWRMAVKIEREFAGQREVTNTITTVKRLAGQLNDQTPFDRVFVATDVNTAPENAQPRFDAAAVRAYCAAVGAWHGELAREVLTFCGLGDER